VHFVELEAGQLVFAVQNSCLWYGDRWSKSLLAGHSLVVCDVLMTQEQRRREFVRLEKQLEDDQRQQALLAAQAAANKNHLVQFVAKVIIQFRFYVP